MAKVILFNENARDFSTRGLGVLSDIVDPVITEVINGIYDMSFFYPPNGRLYSEISSGRIVFAKGPKNYQAFRIKTVEKDDSLNSISVRAFHISYDLADNFIEDTFIQNKGGDGAIKQLLSKTALPHNFIGTSDIQGPFSSRIVRENVLTALLGKEENSFISRAGGQVERDNFRITWLKTMGEDRGVKIKYRKNLVGLRFKEDYTNIVTRIMPQGFDTLFLPEKYIDSPLINDYPNISIRKVKFDSIKSKQINKDDKEALEHQEALKLLRQKAKEYISTVDKPKITADVDFVDLAQTVEYAKYKELETVYIGDIVTIIHGPFNLNFKKQVTSYRYDPVEDRYIFITLGEVENVISNSFNAGTIALNKVEELKRELDTSVLEKYKNIATDLINKGFGGFVKYYKDRMLIMDTDKEETATKVWQFNKNGIGYSKTGIQGTYSYAWTIDGTFNTDFIGANSITANKLTSDVGQSLDLSSNVSVNNTVNTKIVDLKNEIAEDITSRIKTSTEGITLEVNKRFENIKIGGVNLAKNSRYLKDTSWFGYQLTQKKIETISSSDGWNGFKKLTFTNFKETNDGEDFNLACGYSLKSDTDFENDTEYVFSFLAKNYREYSITFFMNGFAKTDRVTLQGYQSKRIVLKATKGTKTFSQIAIATHKKGYYVEFAMAELMVEKGTIPTAWSLAPDEKVSKDEVISSINLSPEKIKIKAINIELDGDTVATSLTSKKIYGTTIEGATIQGNSKIKLGEHGFLQPITNGLQIDAPASSNANYGVGVQIHGKLDGNVPKGVFIYNDPDFSKVDTIADSDDILLTVNGRLDIVNRFDGGLISGCPIISNFYKDNPVQNLYRISFIGLSESGKQLYANDGTDTGDFWINIDDTSSDKRLKENIVKTEFKSLDFIKKLNFYSFDWKENQYGYKNPHTSCGLIADELQELDSTLVYENGKDKIKHIDDFRVLNIALKALQELTEKVEKLEKDNKFLKEKLGVQHE